MPNESAAQLQKKDRPKIQDILPRKNQRDSLLAKIMKPLPPAPSFVSDESGPLLRSFASGFGEKKIEKTIRLRKKIILEESVPLLSGIFGGHRGKSPVSAADGILKKTLYREHAAPAAAEISGARSHALSRLWVRGRDFVRAPHFVFLCGGAAMVAIVLLISFPFARVTVSLEPSVAEFSLDGIRVEAVAGVSEVDGAGKKIPASLIEFAASLKREFPPSAKERVSRKATGTVLIYNMFSSASQTLVAKTRLQDLSGRTFRTQRRVIVPGTLVRNGKIIPRSVSAVVEAERSGAEFNIAPSRFTVPGFAGTPKFAGFYAESSKPFTGGFEGEALVAGQADIDAASEEVTAALFAQLKEELERKIPQGAIAIPGAREITVTAVRKPKAGEAGERFFAEADGTAAVMAFRAEDLFALLGKLALSRDSGRIIAREKSRLEFDRASLSLKNRTLSFEVRGTVAAVSVVSSDEFGRALAGKTRADAENMLRLDSRIRAFGVTIFPPWRSAIPSDEGKMRISVGE